MANFKDEFDVGITSLKTQYANLAFVSEGQYARNLRTHGLNADSIISHFKTTSLGLTEILARQSQKCQLENHMMVETVTLLLIDNYHRAICTVDRNTPKPMVGKSGLLLTLSAIDQVLEVNIDHQLYLLALLRLAEVVLRYTTDCFIGNSARVMRRWSHVSGLINLKMVMTIREGIEILQLRNDFIQECLQKLDKIHAELHEVVLDLAKRERLDHANLVLHEDELQKPNQKLF